MITWGDAGQGDKVLQMLSMQGQSFCGYMNHFNRYPPLFCVSFRQHLKVTGIALAWELDCVRHLSVDLGEVVELYGY